MGKSINLFFQLCHCLPGQLHPIAVNLVNELDDRIFCFEGKGFGKVKHRFYTIESTPLPMLLQPAKGTFYWIVLAVIGGIVG